MPLTLMAGKNYELHYDPKYTVNHKKRDILFLTTTLANLNLFL